MAKSAFKALVVLALLSLATSGQNSRQHLICENVASVSANTQSNSTAFHPRRIYGSPGKRGPAGVKGERGLPGVRGPPGSPAIVDYDHIFNEVEKNARQGLQKMNSRLEELQRSVTTELEQMGEKIESMTEKLKSLLCKEKSGFIYEGKCYFAPYISYSSRINYNQAVEKCSSGNSQIAELKSLAHQKAIHLFFRPKIPSSNTNMYLWIGMTYNSSKQNLRLRSGKEVSIHQFKWETTFPSGSNDKMLIRTIKNGHDQYEGILNYSASDTWQGVLCEKAV